MQNKIWIVSLFSLLILSQSCFRKIEKTELEDQHYHYNPVDYSDSINWASLPTKKDYADLVPHSKFKNNQDSAQVDVFFVHPTLNISKRKWNSKVDNKFVRFIIDRTAMKHQASVFNGSCKIYAPRYRQATIHSYFTTDTKADFAFNLAYNDVYTAFLYYLKHYNNGRKVILAGHSQGTSHLMRLLRDYEDKQWISENVIVAYLIGIPVHKDFFNAYKLCESAVETNCFCAWSTYYEKAEVPEIYNDALVCNPLNWKSDSTFASDSLHSGAVVYRFNNYYPYYNSARVEGGVLKVSKPKHWISKIFTVKNLHMADFNLFWVNFRENIQTRIDAFFEETQN